MKKALVTGATGFLGSAVVRELVATGHEVRAFSRKGAPEEPEWQNLPIEWVAGDLLDRVSITHALEGCDRIYHCAQYVGTRRREREVTYAVNAQGATNLFDMASQAGMSRVVFVSSVLALGVGDPAMPPVDETAPYTLGRMRTPYARAVRLAEMTSRNWRAQGMDVVTVYPGFCAGPGDRRLNSLRLIIAYLKRQLPGYFPGGLCQVDVRDAAHAVVQAMHYGLRGETYLATGYNVTYRNILAMLAHITGRTPLSMQLPIAPAVALGSISELFTPRPMLDSGIVPLLRHTWWYSDQKARRELGIEYRPLEETYADTIAWLVQQGVVTAQQAGMPQQTVTPPVTPSGA